MYLLFCVCFVLLNTVLSDRFPVCNSTLNGCLKCHNDYFCSECQSGYFLLATNLVNSYCIACTTGCQTCDLSGCLVCKKAFVKTSDGKCVCPDGKGLKDGKFCVLCAIVFCNDCTQNYQECSSCYLGKGFDVTNTSGNPKICLVCTQPYCINCGNNHTSCLECADSYGVLNDSCVHCLEGYCKTCASGGDPKCSSCIDGYSGKQPNIAWSDCQDNCDTDCVKCDQQNSSKCYQCKNGMGLDLSYGCQACSDPYCSSCPYNRFACLACQANTANGLNFDTFSCDPCLLEGCQDCSSDYRVCQQCQSTYTMTAQNICTLCTTIHVSNCVQCSGPGICMRCISGFGVVTGVGTCLACQILNCSDCANSALGCMGCEKGYQTTGGLCQKINCSSMPKCSVCTTTNICYKCEDGYGVASSDLTCRICLSGCSKCPFNQIICQECTIGYGIDNYFQCQKCAIKHCAVCTNDYQKCQQCEPQYGLKIIVSPLSFSCIVCQDSYGNSCDNDPSAITSCIELASLELGVCHLCTIQNCTSCYSNSSICEQCGNGTGINVHTVNFQCWSCIDDEHCLLCSSNYQMCEFCQKNYVSAMLGNVCRQCDDPLCYTCLSTDTSSCLSCMAGYGINLLNGSMCNACSDKCLVCFFTNECKACVTGYGLQNDLCIPCDASCDGCSAFDDTTCEGCHPGNYLMGGNCFSCMSECNKCTNSSHCLECNPGVILKLDNTQCISCPNYCTTCYFINLGQINCSACIDYYILNNDVLPSRCVELCGDNITWTYACDITGGQQYDGCLDNCTVEDQFVCNVTLNNESVCSYTGQFEYTFVSVSRATQNANVVDIVVILFPPIVSLKSTESEDLKKIFGFASKNNLNVRSAKYDQFTSQLTLSVDFDSAFSSLKQITIVFLPQNSNDDRYLDSVQSEATLSLPPLTSFQYYSSSMLGNVSMMMYLSYVVVTFAWIAVLVGIFAKRLAGLESMIVVQFAYLNVLWINSEYFYLPYKSLVPLKYSTGYALSIVLQQSHKLSSAISSSAAAPFVSQFSFSNDSLINNFNIMFLCQVLPLLLFVVISVRISYFKYKNGGFLKTQSIYQKLVKMQNIKEFTLQLLLTFTLINLTQMACFQILYIKYGSLQEISSLLILITSILIFVFVMVKFYIDPDPFQYFRYSFKLYKKNNLVLFLTLNHYIVYVVFVFVSIFLLIIPISTSFSFASLIPLSVFLLYSLALRPYCEKSENVRSIFNISVMIVIISFRIYITFSPKQYLNNTLSVILIIIVFSILPLIVAVVAIFSMAFHIMFEKWLKQEEERKTQHEPAYIYRKNKSEILSKLQITNVRLKSKLLPYTETQNVFKRVLEPSKSLMEYTQSLIEGTIQAQKQAIIENMKSTPLRIGAKTGNEKINQKNSNKVEIVRLTDLEKLKMEQISQYSDQEQAQYYNKPKILNSDGQIIKYRESPMAMDILKQQNCHIIYKGTEESVYEEKIKLNNAKSNIFIQQYQDIRS